MDARETPVLQRSEEEKGGGEKKGNSRWVGRIFVYVYGEKVKMDTHEFGGLR